METKYDVNLNMAQQVVSGKFGTVEAAMEYLDTHYYDTDSIMYIVAHLRHFIPNNTILRSEHIVDERLSFGNREYGMFLEELLNNKKGEK